MILRSALPILILALVSCSGTPAGMTMEAHMNAFGALITSTASDCDAHKTAIDAAVDIPAVLALEGPHLTKTTTHVDALNTSVTEMGHCTKDGKAPDTLKMAGSVAKMKAEETAHQTAMAGVAALTDAHTEEDRHHLAMAAQLAMLKTDQAAMSSAASGYTCNMNHSH